ncbi:MAG: glycosyltransferase family 2 protein [Deltaproteobacteria bacterium]|nr:glycosyltransferase family 2 protein [Deltaproteobacteria bacterium]
MHDYEPLVSIIIPTHNRHALLLRSAKSVLAQSYYHFEIIVIDNNSDIPAVALEALQNRRIRIFRTSKYLTAALARNLGLKKARGKYICFLDDDDYCFPEKLKMQVNFLENNKDIDFVYSDIKQIDKKGNVICLQGGPFTVEGMLLYRFISINGCMVRDYVFEDLRFDEKMTTFEDQKLFFQIGLQYKVAYMSGIVGVWNREGRMDQLSNRSIRRSYQNWKRLCEYFEPEILKYKKVKQYYFGKMAVLSFLNGDVRLCVESAMKLLKK